MRQLILSAILCISIFGKVAAQSKIIIGIVPFKNTVENDYNINSRRFSSQDIPAIQDAVTEAFINTKRFSLVEREKMDQIKSEKKLQKNEDFIDGTVIEQSKSLGAQYIVLGNVSKLENQTSSSRVAMGFGTMTSQSAEISFNIKVVDVATGEIMASHSFDGEGKGKKAFETTLNEIKPEIEKFIKDNFKITLSIASIEEKNSTGDAVKVLIAGGSSLGLKEGTELKVYEASELTVDGKKLTRKIPVGKLVIAKVEDENFSVCTVAEGGDAIVKKWDAKAKVKCEIVKE